MIELIITHVKFKNLPAKPNYRNIAEESLKKKHLLFFYKKIYMIFHILFALSQKGGTIVFTTK